MSSTKRQAFAREFNQIYSSYSNGNISGAINSLLGIKARYAAPGEYEERLALNIANRWLKSMHAAQIVVDYLEQAAAPMHECVIIEDALKLPYDRMHSLTQLIPEIADLGAL